MKPSATGREEKVLDPRLARLVRWNYLLGNINECWQFLSLLRKRKKIGEKSTDEQIFVHTALFRSFLVTYGKCFRSTGPGRIKLADREVFPSDHPDRRWHRRILRLRDKLAAHSDASGLEFAHIHVRETHDTLFLTHEYELLLPIPEYAAYGRALRTLRIYVDERLARDKKSLAKTIGKRILLPGVATDAG